MPVESRTLLKLYYSDYHRTWIIETDLGKMCLNGIQLATLSEAMKKEGF